MDDFIASWSDTLSLLKDAFLMCLTGVPTALSLTFFCVVIGFCLAIPFAIIRQRERTLGARIVRFFVFFFTGTPLLVQLYIFYYGFGDFQFIQDLQQIPLLSFLKNGYFWVLLALTLNTAAYSTTIFAGAIRNTDKREIEAAKAYGMNKLTRMRRVILPSSLRRALPAYSNECILTLHATALASTVTIAEITNMASLFNQTYYQPFIAYSAAAIIYLLLNFVLIFGFKQLEKHYLRYLKPRTA